MDQDRHDRIRARAYELWDREGRPEGRARVHWERAQREVNQGPTEQSGGARKGAGSAAHAKPKSSTAGSGAKPPSRPRKATTQADRTASPSRGKKGAAAGQPTPGQDNDPKRGGYLHADTAMGTSHSEMLADLEQTVTGSSGTRGRDGSDEP